MSKVFKVSFHISEKSHVALNMFINGNKQTLALSISFCGGLSCNTGYVNL